MPEHMDGGTRRSWDLRRLATRGGAAQGGTATLAGAGNGRTRPAGAGVSEEAQKALTHADRARDAKEWAAAKAAYALALELGLAVDAGIWVQYGHACKEAGDLGGADAAYHQALRLAPHVADTHLQLGHLRKLQGRRVAAAASYVQASRLDPSLTDARHEFLVLGFPGSAADDLSDPDFELSPGQILQILHGLDGRGHREADDMPVFANASRVILERLDQVAMGLAIRESDLASLFESDSEEIRRVLQTVAGPLRLTPHDRPSLRSVELALLTLALHAPKPLVMPEQDPAPASDAA